ncbi:hypothetical protein [Actinomadura sediminis]|uniref:Carboxypeptidase regulatory-like domain-containing protein n=1 Tax=Actinomadura sediminis TaxID=1038904 RepID=A0ABW3EH53_9ACTN
MPTKKIVPALAAAALVMTGAAAPAQAAPARPAPAPAATPAVPKDGYRAPKTAGTPRRPDVRPLTALRAAAGVPVRIRVIDREGRAPAATYVTLIPLDGSPGFGAEVTDGYLEGVVPDGRYAVTAQVRTGESTTLVHLPDVRPGDLALDARAGVRVLPRVDRAGAALLTASVEVAQRIGGETLPLASTWGDRELYVVPTAPADGLTLRAQAYLTEGGAADGSPYVYGLANVVEGRVADPFPATVRTGTLAAYRTRYGTAGGAACGGGHYGVEWGTGFRIGYYVGAGALPTVRTEYFSPGFTWALDSAITTPDCAFGEFVERSRMVTPRHPGRYEHDWHIGPFAPGPSTAIWSTAGGEPSIAVRLLSTWDSTSHLAPYAGTTGTSRLLDAEGREVYRSDRPGVAHDWSAPPPGEYTLVVDADRKAPWADRASAIRSEVRFTVRDREPVALPYLRVKTPLDIRNRARAGAPQPITLDVEGTTRAPALHVSHDDGRTWRAVRVAEAGGAWRAVIRNPSSGAVSLRATVPGVLDQTLIGAYAVR